MYLKIDYIQVAVLKSICGGQNKIYAGLYDGTPVQIYPTSQSVVIPSVREHFGTLYIDNVTFAGSKDKTIKISDNTITIDSKFSSKSSLYQYNMFYIDAEVTTDVIAGSTQYVAGSMTLKFYYATWKQTTTIGDILFYNNLKYGNSTQITLSTTESKTLTSSIASNGYDEYTIIPTPVRDDVQFRCVGYSSTGSIYGTSYTNLINLLYGENISSSYSLGLGMMCSQTPNAIIFNNFQLDVYIIHT